MIRPEGWVGGWENTVASDVNLERGTRFELATSSLGSWRQVQRERDFQAETGTRLGVVGPCRPLVGLTGVGEGVGDS